MSGRVMTATRLGFAEQARRPLLLVLLVTVPFVFISWSFWVTEAIPRVVELPGGNTVPTTMRDIHGAIMVPITVGFLAGLVGMFVVRSALESDRRLVVAGFSPSEAVAPRLAVIAAATVVVLGVSIAVTALDFVPASWWPFVAANLLAGLTYALIGALAGATMGALGGAYFMFFLPMVDFGIAQNPMFFDGRPPEWAAALPGWGSTRMIVDGAFSSSFEATVGLLAALGWTLALTVAVVLLLRRAVAPRH
ncbi:MAG: ABC transporter permease [bacterium]